MPNCIQACLFRCLKPKVTTPGPGRGQHSSESGHIADEVLAVTDDSRSPSLQHSQSLVASLLPRPTEVGSGSSPKHHEKPTITVSGGASANELKASSSAWQCSTQPSSDFAAMTAYQRSGQMPSRPRSKVSGMTMKQRVKQ